MPTGLFKDPQGKLVRLELNDEQLRAAYDQGYVPFTNEDMQQEQYGSVAQTGLTGLVRGMGGLTLGLSDALLASQEGVADTMRNLEAASPVAATIGEIGGAVLGAALAKKVPTPAGMAATLGSKAARGVEAATLRAFTQPKIGAKVLSRVTAEAARGGVEGGIFGAGMGLSEAALGDPEKAGELIVAGALTGTAFGAGFGGAIGTIAGLSGAAKAKIGDRALKRAQTEHKDFADVLGVLNVMGIKPKKAMKIFKGKGGERFAEDVRWLLTEAPAVDMGDNVLEPVLTANVSKIEVAGERLALAWQRSGKDIEHLKTFMRDRAEHWHAARAEATVPGRQMPGLEMEPGPVQLPDEALSREFARVPGEPTAIGGKVGVTTPRKPDMVWEFRPERPVAPGEFVPDPRSMGPKVYFERGELAAKLEQAVMKEAPEISASAESAELWSGLENMVALVRKGEGAVGKRAPYYDFKHLQDLKEQLKGKEFVKKRLRSLISDAQEELIEEALGKKGLRGYRQAKRIYRSSRDLADELGMGKYLDEKGDFAVAAKRAGEFAARASIARMMYRGSLEPKSMAKAGFIGVPLFYALQKGKNVLEGLRPPLATAYKNMQKMSTLGAAQTRIDGFHIKFRKAIREVLSGSRRSLAYGATLSTLTGEKDRNKALSAYRARIRRYDGDPRRLMDDITMSVQSFAEDAPQIATHAATVIARAVKVAQSVMPPENTTSSLHSLHGEDVYSDSVLSRVDRVLGAVADPVKAFQRVSAGVSTPEEMQVLMEVYPELMGAATQILSEVVADLGRPLTWQESLKLRPFLGSVGHAMLEPRNIALNQGIYVAPEGRPGQPTAMPKSAKLDKLAGSYQTPTQNLEDPR